MRVNSPDKNLSGNKELEMVLPAILTIDSLQLKKPHPTNRTPKSLKTKKLFRNAKKGLPETDFLPPPACPLHFSNFLFSTSQSLKVAC